MRTDKKKLFSVFYDKAYSLAGAPDYINNVIETRILWQGYIRSVGCEIVKTPGGMLPFHSPNLVHIPDPWEIPGRDWHIRVPKEVALRILAIGLP